MRQLYVKKRDSSILTSTGTEAVKTIDRGGEDGKGNTREAVKNGTGTVTHRSALGMERRIVKEENASNTVVLVPCGNPIQNKEPEK